MTQEGPLSLHHLRNMTYIAQTRLTNNNWRQKLGHM